MRILNTKLIPPSEHTFIAQRPQLLNRLPEVERAALTVLQAPAGFGKTCLLSQWFHLLHEAGHKPCWLTIDGSEGDDIDFLTYIVASVSGTGLKLNTRLENILENETLATTDFLTGILVEGFDIASKPVYIFLDDVHRLVAEAGIALNRLIERAPPTAHFIIATRSLPDLHLARARARGMLLEVGANELKFDAAETRDFINRTVDMDLDEKDLSRLQDWTEGWVAGIKLAILALRRGKSTREVLASFTGNNRALSEFFAEEVITSLSSEVREFLLKTSILDHFCPALCDVVAGSENARNIINDIEEKGLFLLQLDEERNWYRYHQLFARYLLNRLNSSYPKLVQELHSRASRWYWDAGFFAEATGHALQAGMPERAAELLEQSCQDLTYYGKIRLVAKFAAQIPEPVLHRCPRVLLTLSWLYTRGLRFEESGKMLDLARELLNEYENTQALPADELRKLQYMLLHREMLLTSANDDVVTLEQHCRRLLDEYPEEQHPYLIGTTCCHLLLARREQYKLDDLEQLWMKVNGIQSRSTYRLLSPALMADLGPSLFFAGKTDAARQVLELGLEHSIPRSPLAALPAMPLAELTYEMNEVDRAEQLINECLPHVRKLGFTDQLMPGFLTLARIRRSQGHFRDAEKALDEGMTIALDRGLERFRLALVAERIKYLIQDGHAGDAARYARSSGIFEINNEPLPLADSTTRDEIRAMAWVRIALSEHRNAEGLHVSRHWRTFCSRRGAVRSLVRWNILNAQLHFVAGQEREAQRALREALSYAASGHMIRSFLDEGMIVNTILSKAYEVYPESPHETDQFAANVLDAFEQTTGRSLSRQVMMTDDVQYHDKLHDKEREILSLVGCGLRNREVADKLGMTEGSVKWYLQQIYDKLGTRRRLQAVERARQLGMIT